MGKIGIAEFKGLNKGLLMLKVLNFSILLLLVGCAHTQDAPSFVKVSDQFVGTWKQSKNCQVHETMKGIVKIQKTAANSERLEVQWVGREFSPFNGVGKIDYIDFEKRSYQVSSDVETFDDGNTVVLASIWKRTEGDKKNIAVIMKRYHLNQKDELIYEKFGYTAFEDDHRVRLKSYSEFFPNNYRCVMTRFQ